MDMERKIIGNRIANRLNLGYLTEEEMREGSEICGVGVYAYLRHIRSAYRGENFPKNETYSNKLYLEHLFSAKCTQIHS